MELANQDLGFGYISLSRSWSFGRKRVFLSSNLEKVDSCFVTPKKKSCVEDSSSMSSDKSVIEALPQDILVSCGSLYMYQYKKNILLYVLCLSYVSVLYDACYEEVF